MSDQHIKMQAITPVIRYLSDGEDTVFTYPFPIFEESDLAVYLDGALQISGYTISGEGDSSGGSVTFDKAPASGIIVTLERLLPLERVSDFLEGGSFSAKALNNEFDYLLASIQQVNRYQERMLRYSDNESDSVCTLPDKSERKGHILGFDDDGNPTIFEPSNSSELPSFLASGTGAVSRNVTGKLTDIVSVKDFGAVGDGLTDDTTAFQSALQAHDAVFVPSGIYLLSSSLALGTQQSIFGTGQASVLQFQSNSYNGIEICGYQNEIRNLRIENGDNAIKLYGDGVECTQNNVCDVVISGCNTGILLDGYEDPSYPCYWNNFARILIEQPLTNGVHLTLSGSGDTPNANKFFCVRVYSKGAETTNAGFYVEHGSYNNSFIDCEANVNGDTAQGCFIIGAGSTKTLLINPYAESSNQVPNVKLEEGSTETSIFNLLSMSDGSAIWDLSGGEYTSYNSGYPYKNRFTDTTVTDLTTTLQRFDTEYIDTSGSVTLDLSHSVHLVSSYGGELTVTIPNAEDSTGAMLMIKKTDSSDNIITIIEEDGDGADGRSIYLGGQNDYVCMVSNGAEWYIVSSNRLAGNTRYYDGTGTYDIDMAVDIYLLSSYSGELTARLPPADAAEAVGRSVTIKKTDTSSNAVTVTEQGGSGLDGYDQTLSSQYEAITVVSNGANWYIISRF